MTWHTFLLWTGAGLLLAGCSAQTEQDALTDQIAQSIRVGDAASESRPGYGFDLYPGAEVTSSLLDGMSLSIQTEASFEEVVAFYEGQLAERGWRIQSRDLKDGRMTLKSVMPADGEEMMNVTVARAKQPGAYQLIFLKMMLGE